MTHVWEVLRFELGYQLGRASTRLYFAIFLVLSVLAAGAFLMDARNDGYFFNAPIITAAVTIVASMAALLVTAGVAGDAATRDVDLRMHSLLYTTPLRKRAYLAGRFLGAFAVTALLLVAVPIGLLLATRMPGVPPHLVGPFRAEAYLGSYLMFAVPNAFLATATLFSVALLTRRAIASYAGAGALFFGAVICEGFIAGSLGRWELARVLDPLGYTTMHGLWLSLNPLQKNTRTITLEGAVLTNRMLWLGVAVVVLALAHLRFRFAYDGGGRGWRRAAQAEDVPVVRWSGVTVPRARRAFDAATRVRQIVAVATRSFRDLVASRGWLIVPLTVVAFILTAPEVLEVELGTPGAATTARVAELLGHGELSRLIALLVAVSAGMLVWRERDAGIDAIADVTPVPEWVSVLGKFAAIALMLALTQTILIGAGMIVQAMLGFSSFEPALYAKVLLGFELTGFLLFAALAMFIHVVVNQKYVGNVLAILAYVGLQMARELGVEHNLLLYGGAPRPSYTQMSGFGAQVGPWLWFTLYWAGWALLFGVVSYLLWSRGEERGLRARLALARRRLTRWPAAVGAAALAVIAGVGGFVFYNTNVLHRYETDAQREERRAEYERRYGRYASIPQPLHAATKLHVELYPSRNAATIRGSYLLENRSGAAIDTLHVVVSPDVETSGIVFDRPSRLTVDDRDFGYRIYTLARPVRPGQSVRMDFRVAYAPRGFTNDGRNPSVQHNGSWIQHRAEQSHGDRQWLPFIGYQRNRELQNAGTRKQHGLPERPAVRRLEDRAARYEQKGNEKIAFEAIVGTDGDETAVAPGALRRSWSDHGRNYYHYVADAPIRNAWAIFSARYALHRARWRHVAIEVFHHPAHRGNLERMVRGVRASLDYNTRHFGPYAHRQVRVVEYPSTGRGLRLTAHPGLIMYSEGFALVRPEDDPRRIDFPFAIVAHEMGHQWWGHQVDPAPVEGSALLTESLAWYSSLSVIEETLGREHLIRLLDIMRSQYLAPHETREVPLLRSVDRIDAYRTGPFAMWALRESVGEAPVNAALRNLVAKFRSSRPPYATSLDLYHELRAVTPASMHYLLEDLFEEITFWDLRTKSVRARPAANGTYAVTLHVEAQKLEASAEGKERPVPLNDAVEVAVFDANGRPLYRAPHRIRSGGQTITVVVSRQPARAGVDPDHTLLDREPENNEAEAQLARGRG